MCSWRLCFAGIKYDIPRLLHHQTTPPRPTGAATEAYLTLTLVPIRDAPGVVVADHIANHGA